MMNLFWIIYEFLEKQIEPRFARSESLLGLMISKTPFCSLGLWPFWGPSLPKLRVLLAKTRLLNRGMCFLLCLDSRFALGAGMSELPVLILC